MKRTCGDYGGRLKDGAPCTRIASWGRGKKARKDGGPCKDHTDEALAKIVTLKKQTLRLIADPMKTVVEVAREVGVVVSRFYEWQQLDEEFEKEWLTLQAEKDRVRVTIVEDNLFKRAAQEAKINPAESIFFLKNRAPQRWRDKVEREITGKDGTPLIPVEAMRALLEEED